MIFPHEPLLTGHTSSLFPLCCCATSDDADRFVQKQFGGVRTNLSHRLDKTGQVLFLVPAAIACLSLQRPFLVGWISASGVHSSSILVAPDVSIVYQDKAWKLGDLKLWSPMFCLIRSHSFRSSNFDALQDQILMKNLLQVLMVGQCGLQVDCENLPCLSVLQLQPTKHHMSNLSPCLMVKSTPNDYWIAKKRQQTHIILLVRNPHPKWYPIAISPNLPPSFFFDIHQPKKPGDCRPRNVTAVGTTKGPRLAVHVVDTFDSVLEIVLESWAAKMTGEKWDFDHHLMGFLGI